MFRPPKVVFLFNALNYKVMKNTSTKVVNRYYQIDGLTPRGSIVATIFCKANSVEEVRAQLAKSAPAEASTSQRNAPPPSVAAYRGSLRAIYSTIPPPVLSAPAAPARHKVPHLK